MRDAPEEPGPISELDVLLTAAEAYPAFERLFLTARREILAGFRVFDLDTRLRSSEAGEIGETWFDLMAHTLERGVAISLVLTDFDPVVATDRHRASWAAARRLAGAAEAAGRARLTFRVARHPARAGLVPRLLFRPKVLEKFRRADPDPLTPGLADVSRHDLFDLAPATHHQKLAVFDRETVYIGGLDLNERRFDTPAHDRASEETWRDVQLIACGPVAGAAAAHLESFEATSRGHATPARQAPGFLRTLSQRRRFAPFRISPKTVVSEIEQAHFDAIGRAERLIYLESQFFRHLPLAEALARAASDQPDLGLLMVLPAAPEDVAFEGNRAGDARLGAHLQVEAIDTVQAAFGARALIASPALPRRADDPNADGAVAGAPLVYVHSKVSIFDTREAIVSSANLNGRSLRWDTEAGVHLTRTDQVKHLAGRLLEPWNAGPLPWDEESGAGLVAQWRKAVEANARRAPQARSGLLVPYDPADARALGEAIPVVPNELV